MTFRVIYHPLVKSDLSFLNRDILFRIEKAITSRLQKSPFDYGKPLTANLRGFWSMRVGDYRIVYRVIHEEITIFAILHRKDVYWRVQKRNL